MSRREKHLEIVNRIAAGETVRQIAESWGVTPRAIRHYIAEPNPRRTKPCGTNAAYKRHLRAGERPCLACYDARAASQREWKRANKEKQAREGVEKAHRSDEHAPQVSQHTNPPERALEG